MRSFSLYSIQSLARSVAPPLASSFHQGITLHDITSSFFSFLLSYVPCSSRLPLSFPFRSIPFFSIPIYSIPIPSLSIRFLDVPFFSFSFSSLPFYSIPSLPIPSHPSLFSPFLSLSLIPVIFLRALSPSQTT